MFSSIKEKIKVYKIRKALTDRERVIFEYLYENKKGATRETIKKETGYSMSGWVWGRLKSVGVEIKTKNKKYYISEIY